MHGSLLLCHLEIEHPTEHNVHPAVGLSGDFDGRLLIVRKDLT